MESGSSLTGRRVGFVTAFFSGKLSALAGEAEGGLVRRLVERLLSSLESVRR